MRDLILEKLVRAFAQLPFSWAGALGGVAGRVLYRLRGREVRNARINLSLCFPDIDEVERERLVRRNLIDTGRSLGEMLRIWVGRRLDFAALVDENGFEQAARDLLQRGNGLIIALPHMGNWELVNHFIMRVTPTTALFRPPRLRFMDRVMREGRGRTGLTPVPIDRSGLKTLHAAMKRGEGTIILPDQVPKAAGSSGVIAPFFGHPAMTMTLISRLARRHRAPVLFCYIVREAPGDRYRIHHFEGEAAIGDASPEAAAAALNRGVERCARAFPAAYQWTYRRFEIPGQRRDSPYARRR